MRNILLILLLVGCGKIKHFSTVYKGIDPKIQPYIDEWVRETGLAVNIPVNFHNTFDRQTIIAHCIYKNVKYPYKYRKGLEIMIRKTWWDKVEYDDRLEVVYHELGHCVLNRDHIDDILLDGCPKSIMHSHSFSGECFKTRYNYYMDELLSGGM